ncbi:hypothetical protein PSN45_001647 [Yamadazyma tenuis]|uniref:DUF221-domain-containing protein n=1 Tax=Candida tenuis (strain ATCC 10573 / BCRC 21748 / CBS 615 / JCM 9827 / NBRC 10315 / NRRL Y-1498 / VKM Y-70) TaxID=590646 RepID=G3BET1_CANTC|nr:uncharacterized protein CANTEDRAFT_137066 [Yamadazyma tenuis ATCC 10573]EGV60586.1 hypothetical protein CANTEDRAFT_137066 [Yamadazyma tenuis ATCC 10573]WEJ94167.1 hypothetical protein PSN45_001647 [Yamadazyma tenuis]
MTDSRSTSTSAVVSSLLANLALFGCFLGGFLLLRVKFKRIYSPRSSFKIGPEESQPPELSIDPISWIFKLLFRTQSQVIQYAGLDGYFFLRYIFMMMAIFFGGVFTYVILLPINATNGNGNEGFDQLSISNVKDHNRYYAHVLVGWVFYGAVMAVIFRELFFYNSIRCAALASPKYAKKLSSRTILFQSVPDALLDEKQFFKMFNGVKRVWVVRNLRKLDGKIRRRTNLVHKLEAAENSLLAKAYKRKLKSEKKKVLVEDPGNINSYVPEKKRPRHRANGLFKSKVDTIDYCLEEIPKVDAEVKKLQKAHKTSKPKNSIFVEFENQYTAQLAFQSTIHHNPLRMKACATGMEPGDVIWANLRLFWWEANVRTLIAIAAVTAVIILWAVPVAFVGVISNITYLTNKLPWLRWILKLKKKLLGIITGLLPTILLKVLFAVLPVFIRANGRVAGCATVQQIELFAHDTYFGFLIVNSFIVVTLASSASSVVTQIIDNPTSAMQLLASNLPKASNFFISYIVLQGFTISGTTLFQVVSLFVFYFLTTLLDKTVRKKHTRYTTLDGMTYGTTFPVYINLVCITLAYAIISPMILIFAFLAFLLVFLAYSYNLTYIMLPGPDVRGMHYPKALFQTIIGIYLGQVCLLGIFVVGKGWGPIVLQAIGIGFTAFCHYTLNQSFGHLLSVVPIDVMKPLDGVSETPSYNGQTDYKTKVLDVRRYRHHQSQPDKHLEAAIANENKVNSQVKQDLIKEDAEINQNETVYSVTPVLADRDMKKLESTNWFVRFIRPDVFANYRHARRLLPANYNVEPDEVDDRHAYSSPNVAQTLPTIWIPEDPMGLSKIEIEKAKAKSAISMSDQNAGFDTKGNFVYTGPPPA